jgi:DNA polymerase V
MAARNLAATGCTWWVVYDYKSLEAVPSYDGPLSLDFYGRIHPRHSSGTVKLTTPTGSVRLIAPPLLRQFDEKTDHRLLYRRLGVCAADVSEDEGILQMDLFTDAGALERERRLQGAMLAVRRRYGPNAVFKGMDLLEGATTLERNRQIGGHRA